MDQDPARPKHPVEHVLDLFLYAPVGFVAEAPSLLPRFVKRGRDQVAMVRAVGMYAIRRDPDELEAIVHRHPRAQSTMKALGLVTGTGRQSSNGSRDMSSSMTVPSSQAGDVAGRPDATDRDNVAGQEPDVVSGGDVASLAIPDYESLSASQVVPRLESLTGDELEAIRLYEHSNRARRTILNKIAQLQAA